MKTYLKIQFSSDGAKPSHIIKRLEDMGWRPVVGEYDFMKESGLGEGVGASFRNMLDELQGALKGTGASFTVYSTN